MKQNEKIWKKKMKKKNCERNKSQAYGWAM